MPRNGAENGSDSTDDSFRPSRRSYLKAAGAAAVSVPLLAGEAAAATTRHGISFDTVVDMVADAGCDPSGNEPCDGALQSAAGSNTLLRFPSGTYKFTEKNALNGYSNFGIVGDGDVTFTVPNDFNKKLLTINYGTGALVENITVDQSDSCPCVQVAPNDKLEVHGLEIVGQSLVSGDDAMNAFEPMVRSSDGEGLVTDLVAHNAGRMGAYARVGVWIGAVNKGTVTLRNCNVEGFSSNGVYASRTPGVVHVEGGLFKNNDLSQVRIGSAGSYVEGATCETDVSESNSPNPDEMLNGTGIRIEKAGGGSGAEIRDCDVRVGPDVNANAGIQVLKNYGAFSIENTRVEFNPDRAYSIRAFSPDGSYDDTSVTLNNVSVTGEADGFVGVLIEDRPDTVVENCCIHQPGNGRIGLALDNCDGSRVTNCTINAGAQALRIRNGNVAVSNIDEGGTCPAPNLSSPGYDGSSSADSNSSSDSSDSSTSSDSSSDDSSSSSDSSSDDSSGNPDGSGSHDELSGNIDESEVPEPPAEAELVVTDTDTAGDRIPYEITTSGDIDHASNYGTTPDGNDPISGNTVNGGVNEWRDSYSYEGEIVSLEIDDRATLKLDESEQTITMIGHENGYIDYAFEVSGQLEEVDGSLDNGGDQISDDGSSATGGIIRNRDVYNYSGELIHASIEDGVSITTRPETLEE